MIISKKKLEFMIRNAKEEAMCDVAKARDTDERDRERARAMNEALRDIDRRITELENKLGERKSNEINCVGNRYWV